jgi:tRNA(fMet)-specific endonuclease VapC
MSFIIDTDICSAHLRHINKVSNRFFQYMGRLNISTITLGELYTWIYRLNAPGRRYASLIEMLNDITILSVTPEVGKNTANCKRDYWISGNPLLRWI